MADTTDRLGSVLCVPKEKITCPKCQSSIFVPKDFIRTGGVVHCGRCGTSYRRAARPNCTFDFVGGVTQFVSGTKYFYRDDTRPGKYFRIETATKEQFDEALAEYGCLYVQRVKKNGGNFEFQDAMKDLPR